MNTETWRSGYAWKNEKFYRFQPDSILVMRLWPQMLAWRRTRARGWQPTRKWADRFLCELPLNPGRIERAHAEIASFVGPHDTRQTQDYAFLRSPALLHAFTTIPDRERGVAAAFLDRRWHVLAMMARCQWATDLLQANPALGFALASNWILHKPEVSQPLRSARALLRKPQLAIMEWLGFPRSERVRRLLARIPPSALRARKLPQLRAALSAPGCQALLAHLPAIPEEVLCFVYHEDTRRRLTPRFVHQLAELSTATNAFTTHHFNLWLNALRMSSTLDRPRLASLSSLNHLARWHDDLTTAINAQTGAAQERLIAARFDSVPLHGAPGVSPVVSGQELLAEGQAMRHCVASYCDDILNGHYFVYRVTSPVRATLGIRRDGSRWVLDQIKGPGNTEVSLAHREVIWDAFVLQQR